jgi:hypothetical protein
VARTQSPSRPSFCSRSQMCGKRPDEPARPAISGYRQVPPRSASPWAVPHTESAEGTRWLEFARYSLVVRAAAVEPDPRLSAFAGGAVGWRCAAQVPGPLSADAIAWARATFEGAPLPMRAFLVAGWTALMLEGRPRSDATHILGWPIVQSAPQSAVLQRQSKFGIKATLLFATEPSAVTFSSAMVLTSRLGRMVWTVVAPVHRWTVRVVLSHAAAVIAQCHAS